MNVLQPLHIPAQQTGADQSLRAGADALKDTLQAITDLANKTCDQLGDDVDGRDYVTMASMVERSIRTNWLEASTDHREGYLRALADLLGIVGDDCGLPRPWDPITTTETAFALRRQTDQPSGHQVPS